MKKLVGWQCVMLVVCLFLSLGSIGSAKECKVVFDEKAATIAGAMVASNEAMELTNQNDRKQQCLTATISAIHLEISRYEKRIEFRKQQDNPKDLLQLQESLEALKTDLAKHRAMDVHDFQLPEKVSTIAWVGDKAGIDAILYTSTMTKNGPWYHIAGVAEGSANALRPNTHYQIEYYSVYPRNYWGMESAYVYIANVSAMQADVQPPTKSKKIMGEVFMYQYKGPLYDVVKCDHYQVYLLKDRKPGAKGEPILDSKESKFTVSLTEELLKEYSYIEFVSSNGSKTLALNEIKTDALTIMLEREVYLKKPAIYLYPEQKTEITVTHQFKGTIVSTYPHYTDRWTVVAEPNGKLLSATDNRYYNYLFWDGRFSFPKEHYQFQSGFYVKNGEYISFLQQKLATIGLSENEINDFIVYWLPVMNQYETCFVHFRINDDIDGSSVLITKPEPETTIRVFMEFSGVEKGDRIATLPEQKLPTFVRKGFTLVEWGGAEIGDNKIE